MLRPQRQYFGQSDNSYFLTCLEKKRFSIILIINLLLMIFGSIGRAEQSPVLDENRELPGLGFLQRRDEKLIPEDPLVLKYLEQIQDVSSPEKQLLPSMECLQAQTFNNAIVAMAFILKAEGQRAERILDFYAAAINKDNTDPTLQNFYYNDQARGFFQDVAIRDCNHAGNGNLRSGNYTIKAYHHLGHSDRWMGDMAWLAIVYQYYERQYSSDKYAKIQGLLKYLLISWYKDDPNGGGYVQHGWRDGDRKLHEEYGHHEGNIDCYALFKLLGQDELAEKVKIWLDRELGTKKNLPLDLYTWRVLAGMAESTMLNIPEYDLRYRKVIEQNGNKVVGFFNLPDINTENIWLDGTGHIACAYISKGNKQRGYFYADQLDKLLIERTIAGVKTRALPYTANRNGGYEWVDTNKGFISVCAWYIFAKNNFNPMNLEKRIAENTSAGNPDEQGMYFSKKAYQPHPLPKFDEMRSRLPNPIYDENPLWVDMYWKTWELAFKNFHGPAEDSGFVSQFIDAAFNAYTYLWDTAIMTMFLNTAHPLTPGIASLDNFYAKQHSTGEICREIKRSDGADFEQWSNVENLPLFSRWGFDEYFNPYRADVTYKNRKTPAPNPKLTLDALNHPIAAWAELESYKWTGDKARLKMVREPLIKYYESLKKYIRQGNGLYITDWASMDNSPRNICLVGGGSGVDISAEMVLFARNLAELSTILGYEKEAKNFGNEADHLASLINQKMWNAEKKFYFDLTLDEAFCHAKTIAAFWTLVSKTATPERAKLLAAHLKNPKTFGRLHPVPTLAADEKEYYPEGGYWSGAVWIAMNTMIIKGLEAYGYNSLAEEIVLKHLDAMATVYKKTGTIWENYAADLIKEGVNTNGAAVAKEMVGFSGVTPILHFIEYGVGLKPNAPKNELLWKINSNQRSGCERFRFNGHVVDLIAEPSEKTVKITIQSDEKFVLRIARAGKEKSYNIVKGKNDLIFTP